MNALHNIIERYIVRVLHAVDRPRKLYEYWVTGRGYFPIDMLRYDSAWPADGESASLIVSVSPGGVYAEERRKQLTESRSIKLHSYREPTSDRWWSFGWSVSARKF